MSELLWNCRLSYLIVAVIRINFCEFSKSRSWFTEIPSLKPKKNYPLFSVVLTFPFYWKHAAYCFFLHQNLQPDCFAKHILSTMKSFHILTMIFLLMTSYWMQKSHQNFPNSIITTCYCGPTSSYLPTSFESKSATMELGLTINPCVAKRQSVPLLTLSQVKLSVFITTTKGYIPQKMFTFCFGWCREVRTWHSL